MSYMMPAGAEIEFDNLSEYDNHDAFISRELEDAYTEAVSKIYENQITWSLAESIAKMWAQAFLENDFDNIDVAKIAEKLNFNWKDCYAILGDKENLMNEILKERFAE